MNSGLFWTILRIEVKIYFRAFNGSIAFNFQQNICLAVKEMQTTNLNVGEWVMGMKYSDFTRIVLYSNIYPIFTRLHRLIQQSGGYL